MRGLLGWMWVGVFVYIALRLSWSVLRAPAERRRSLIGKYLVIFAIAYLGTLGMFLVLERGMIFRPTSVADGWGVPTDFTPQDVELTLDDGTRIHAWWCPVPDARGVIHYSHGNAGNLAGRAGIASWLRRRGWSVFLYDYPGFGKSTGRPDEQNCYAAGLASYRWLRQEQKVDPEQLILWGKSLGGGVATELAMQVEHRALVLFSPFSSIPDMAQKLFPIFPARWLVRTQFDNATKIKTYRGRLLVGWYDEDPLVPADQSRLVYELATQADERRGEPFPGRIHGAPPEIFVDILTEWYDKLK
ncbi:MAG TPA: alpha/beta fold hydrolase [Gemmatales bacterium]|mgnify:CR=1 FL=1|nr:alpha/beta fold hydrolase [Gemmatales bacterium]HMP58352.1 alpha/beta fold hydrolase [Gemmatales bacterium]